MRTMEKRWVLIGFKHVGKTRVGKCLAKQLGCAFDDLDHLISAYFAKQTGKSHTCREIMQTQGKTFFEHQETQVLGDFLANHPPTGVLALGGGTPLRPVNCKLLQRYPTQIIWITAKKEVVFARLIANGIPAFFSKGIPIRKSFEKLWQARMPIYRGLAEITVDNTHAPTKTVRALMRAISAQSE